MRKIILAAALAAVAALGTGCGASCEDACDAISSCVTKVGGTADAECVKKCDNANCDAKDDAVSCFADIKCETAESGLGEMLACALKCPSLTSGQ